MVYLGGLLIALSMRRAVLVQLMPERVTLYRVDESGTVYNKFRVRIANRSSKAERVMFTTESLPGAKILLERNPVTLEPGATVEQGFEVSAARFAGAQDVNRFPIVVDAEAARERDSFDETFLMPPERSPK